MFNWIIKKIIGTKNQRTVRKLMPTVAEINLDAVPYTPVFDWLQSVGGVAEREPALEFTRMFFSAAAAAAPRQRTRRRRRCQQRGSRAARRSSAAAYRRAGAALQWAAACSASCPF
jgi:hypothetical protein